MKLLIVDDSMVIRDAISMYVAKAGIEVVGQAGSGDEAVEIFERTLPEVVTMDITMPGMDGLEATEKLMQLKPDVAIIIVSGVTQKGIALEALKRGAKQFIKKPFNADQLLTALDKVVGALSS